MRLLTVCLVSFALMVQTASFADAKSTGFGSAKRISMPKAPSTVKAFSKPATPSTSTAAKPSVWTKPSGGTFTSNAVGWGKPQPTKTAFAATAAAPPALQVTRIPVKSTTLGDAITKSRSADAIRARDAQISAARAKPTVSASLGSTQYTYAKVSQDQSTYISTWRTRNPGYRPIIVSYPPTYSSTFSDTFMSLMMYNALFGYNHQNDADYQAWRAQANQAAQDNADLKAQLQNLDTQMTDLKTKGTAPDPSYMPPDVPADVAYNPDVVVGSARPVLTVGTGAQGGVYNAFCQGSDALNISGLQYFAATNFDVKCISTKGAVENLSGLGTTFDAVLAQADVLDAYEAKNAVDAGQNVIPAYKELFWLIVSKDSGINSVDDLDASKYTLYLPPEGSGARVTWNTIASFASTDGFLFSSWGANNSFAELSKTAQTIPTMLDGAAAVAKDPKAVVFGIMGLNSALMKQINDVYGEQVKLVPVYDDSFAKVTDHNGQYLYSSCTVPGGTYPKLQPGWLSTTVDTLCVDALFILSKDSTADLQSNVLTAAAPAITELQTAMGQQ